MTKAIFKQLIIRTRDSINPSVKIPSTTVDFWFDKYFKFYDKETLERIFDYIGGTHDYWPSINKILDIFREFGYNPPLHEQIELMKKGIVSFIPAKETKKWIKFSVNTAEKKQ